MHVGGCLLLTTIAWSFPYVLTEGPARTRNKRHLLPLMGFLQGYKMGQNFALQLPPLVVSPVVVFPVNQQQSIQIQGSNESYNENVSNLVLPEKITKLHNLSNSPIIQDISNKEMKNSVDLLKNDAIEEDIFRQSFTNDTTIEAEEIKGDNNTVTEITTISNNITIITTPYGPYPNANYINDNITQLSITESPIGETFQLPTTDNSWKNFSSNVLTTELQVESRTGEVWAGDLNYSKPDVTRDSYYYNDNSQPNVNSYYRRPPNQLNREGWSTNYIEDNKFTSEFRPLAGLYYDGYLHKPPPKKSGFLPYENTYYY